MSQNSNPDLFLTSPKLQVLPIKSGSVGEDEMKNLEHVAQILAHGKHFPFFSFVGDWLAQFTLHWYQWFLFLASSLPSCHVPSTWQGDSARSYSEIDYNLFSLTSFLPFYSPRSHRWAVLSFPWVTCPFENLMKAIDVFLRKHAHKDIRTQTHTHTHRHFVFKFTDPWVLWTPGVLRNPS